MQRTRQATGCFLIAHALTNVILLVAAESACGEPIAALTIAYGVGALAQSVAALAVVCFIELDRCGAKPRAGAGTALLPILGEMAVAAYLAVALARGPASNCALLAWGLKLDVAVTIAMSAFWACVAARVAYCVPRTVAPAAYGEEGPVESGDDAACASQSSCGTPAAETRGHLSFDSVAEHSVSVGA